MHSIFVRHEVDDGSASSKSLNFITVSEPAMFLTLQEYQDLKFDAKIKSRHSRQKIHQNFPLKSLEIFYDN